MEMGLLGTHMALEMKGILLKVPLDKAFVNGKNFFLNLTNRGPCGPPSTEVLSSYLAKAHLH